MRIKTAKISILLRTYFSDNVIRLVHCEYFNILVFYYFFILFQVTLTRQPSFVAALKVRNFNLCFLLFIIISKPSVVAPRHKTTFKCSRSQYRSILHFLFKILTWGVIFQAHYNLNAVKLSTITLMLFCLNLLHILLIISVSSMVIIIFSHSL